MAAPRKSSLDAKALQNVFDKLDRKQHAELVKNIAASKGVSIRQAQRLITKGEQKRGQSDKYDIKVGNAIRNYLKKTELYKADKPNIAENNAPARGAVIMQEPFSSYDDAMKRANEYREYAGIPKPETLREDEEDYYDEDLDDEEEELVSAPIFQRVAEVTVTYIPAGSRYDEGYGNAYQKATAPAGGVYLVQMRD